MFDRLRRYNLKWRENNGLIMNQLILGCTLPSFLGSLMLSGNSNLRLPQERTVIIKDTETGTRIYGSVGDLYERLADQHTINQ